MIAHDFPELDGIPLEEAVHNHMANISAYAQFDWYKHVWYINQSEYTTESTRKLGRWIGVAENQGVSMMYMVLLKSCQPIARSSVFPLTQDDWLSAKVQALKVELDTSIQEKIGDKHLDVDCFAKFPEVPEVPKDIFLDDEPTSVPVEGEESMPEVDKYYSPEAYDQYLTASVLMDRGGEAMLGLKPATKPDGSKIYEYILCYVDDCIFQGLDPLGFMDYPRTVYTLKDGTVQEQETYLSADIQRHKLADGKKALAISSDTYVRRAVEEVERELAKIGKQLKRKVVLPLASGYRPKLDALPELDENRASYFASLMGVLHWCIKLGWINIIVEVNLLARFQACPREGNLEQMFHLFAYLNHHWCLIGRNPAWIR
jgi:hypothetical protein